MLIYFSKGQLYVSWAQYHNYISLTGDASLEIKWSKIQVKLKCRKIKQQYVMHSKYESKNATEILFHKDIIRLQQVDEYRVYASLYFFVLVFIVLIDEYILLPVVFPLFAGCVPVSWNWRVFFLHALSRTNTFLARTT